MQAGFEKVYGLVEKARLSIPVDTKSLDDIRDTYGYALYNEALGAVLERHSLGWLLAERLNDFYKDFDYYDYTDKLEDTEQDAIEGLTGQLKDPDAVCGILDTLADIKENGELSVAQSLVADELVLDLAELQVRLGKSVSEVIGKAIERSHENKAIKLTIDILQLKQGDEMHHLRFTRLDWLENGVNSVVCKNYNHVYRYTDEDPVNLEDNNAVMDSLENVYTRFNLRQPEDFKGHSLSVSDVVVLTTGGLSKAFYCDSFGFEQLPDSFVKDFTTEKTMTELERD